MAKKMPLDRLRQISKTRKPQVLVRPESPRDESRSVRVLHPETPESSEN
jgi:hypothetical protein